MCIRDRIKPERRPFAMGAHDLPSPCDGKLTVFPITPDAQFTVKGQTYTLGTLLRDETLAAQFEGGYCFIFRLTVDDYHRYHYLDSGTKGENIYLPGKLHTCLLYTSTVSSAAKRVNGKSMMHLIASGFQKGTELTIQCEGPDEACLLYTSSVVQKYRRRPGG